MKDLIGIDEGCSGPKSYPYFDERAGELDGTMIATKVSLVPFRSSHYVQDCQGAKYSTAIVDVMYEQTRNVIETVEFQTTNIRLDPKYFEWYTPITDPSITNSPNKGNAPGGIDGLSQTIRRMIYTRTYYMLPALPYELFLDTYDGGWIGGVHSVAADTKIKVTNPGISSFCLAPNSDSTSLLTFPAFSLLLLDPVVGENPALESLQGGVDSFVWRLGYKLKVRWLFRPEGHNLYWRSDKVRVGSDQLLGFFDYIKLRGRPSTDGTLGGDDNRYTAFPSYDMSTLLQGSTAWGTPSPVESPCDTYFPKTTAG
jgi:hypothetical protein